MPKAKVKVAPAPPVVEDENIVRIIVRGTEIFFNKKAHKFHRFEKDVKIPIISVTGFTQAMDKPQLKYWAVNVTCDFLLKKIENKEVITLTDIEEARGQHTAESNKAKDIGTLAHEWIDGWISGKNPEFPTNPAVVSVINAFLQFNDSHKIQWLEGELADGKGVVWSPTYDYAGIFDRIVMFDGKRLLVDFKSSNAHYEDYAFQTAAYQFAKEEMYPDQFIDGRLVIRLAKETEEEYYARMEEKNRKLIARSKKPQEIKPYLAFEPKFYYDFTKDFDAAKGLLTAVRRVKELSKEEE